MAKFVSDTVMDAGLNEVKTKADKLTICEGQPTTYAQATTLKSGGGKKLAEVAIDSTDFTGPADGDVSGRKVTVAAQSGTVTESGTADHVALVDDGASVLQIVTTISNSQAVTAANSFTTSAFDHEILDVSA